MRIDRALWISAFAWISIFAAGTMALIVRIGWFSSNVPKCAFGMEPPRFPPSDVALVVALFVMSHVCPLLVRRRRIARRTVHVFAEDATYRTPPSRAFIVLNAEHIAAAERSRRLVSLAWSLAFALSIAWLGFATIRYSPHGPCQHPLEWWSYFAASAATLLSHLPIYSGVGCAAD